MAAEACRAAIMTVWRLSDDPKEIVLVNTMSQQACAARDNDGCHRASVNAWFGYGAPVDVVASIGWRQRDAARRRRAAGVRGSSQIVSFPRSTPRRDTPGSRSWSPSGRRPRLLR